MKKVFGNSMKKKVLDRLFLNSRKKKFLNYLKYGQDKKPIYNAETFADALMIGDEEKANKILHEMIKRKVK